MVKKLLFVILLFSYVSFGFGQTVIIPASNTSDGAVNDPYGTWWGFERSAMIYTNAQIGTTGDINNVGFFLNTVNTPQDAVDVRIYMKTRTTTFAANTAYANETTGATLVYGPTTIPAASFTANNWITVALTTPFTYTGNNLEIIIETNATGSGNGDGSTGKQFRYQTQGSNQFYQYWNGDNSAPTGNGTRSANRPNVSLNFLALTPCSGTPIGGTIAVSPTSGSPGSNYGVTASGYTTGTGLTYQWEYSDTGGATWTAQGAATSIYTALSGLVAPAVGVVRTWRLVVTCTATTSSANSSMGTFTSAITYCTPTNTYSTAYYISGVTTSGGLANINNTPTGFSAYTDYTSFFVRSFPGGDFTITATHPSSTYGYSVWIDWNNDGDFIDAGENVISTAYLATPATLPQITIPGGQALGNYRMRIRNAYLSNPAPVCGSHDYGEAEDYTLELVAAPPCASRPTVTTATGVTPTSATLNWTAATPAPALGYQYYYSTVNTAPNAGTAPSGPDVGPGVLFANITGLTPFTQYYYWVRSNCNASDKSAWAGPSTFTTPPVPPVNDECGAAIGLTVNSDLLCGVVTAGTTVAATASGQPDDVSGTPNNDVWFSFVATGPSHQISLLNVVAVIGSSTDMGMGVYSSVGGVCSVLTLVGSSDPNVYDVVGLTAGTTYFVRVYGWASGASTAQANFNICVGTPPPPPNNDLCINATNLSCGTTNLAGTTNLTSNIPTISGCTMSNYGVWYTFVGDGQASTISSTSTGGFDHEMSISTGNCTNQTSIACVDNVFGTGTETYTFNTVNLTQYYVYIAYNYSFGSTTGNFTISRTCSAPTYCIPSSNNNTPDYISNFTATGTSTINNNSGAGVTSTGYSNYTLPPSPLTVTQIEGGTINFSVTLAGGTQGVNIWVDWNDDLTFSPAEKVYSSGGYINGGVTGSFIVPAPSAGTHRMRIRSDYFSTDPSACGNISYGEAEDYLITITPLNCTANPQSLTATATSTTSADISWAAPSPAPALGYEYVVSTDPTGIPVIASGTTSATNVSVTGLSAGTTYYVFVRGICNVTDFGFWVTTTLTTGCTNITNTPTVCPVIVDVQGSNPFTAIPFVADPTTEIGCTTPTATLVANANLRQTTSYRVEQITYPSPAPNYNFPTLGGSPQLITSDDVWAPSWTNLGFNFCFYGNTYSQGLVGANGALTFNSTIAAGSASGYAFSNNLPSILGALFEQTIYGVYHDIDPRNLLGTPIKSRTVGTPGCRQFQVAWNDIPMFGDSTRLYTGMIVLHETTNIIEVFIKEKRIENGNVNPWNDGNALVGIQGTRSPAQWVAAPCRNSLDTNWETTNEAWRFVPNGAVIAPVSVTWYQGSVAPGNVVTGNANNSLTVSTGGTYFASVEYNLCSGPITLVDEIVVTDTKKTWNGSFDNNWYRAANWSPAAVPTITDCVVIPSTASTNGRSPIADYSNLPPPTPPSIARAKNIRVMNNGGLEVSAGTFLEIEEWLNVAASGSVMIRSTGSLIQLNDVATNNNTGNIRMQREVLGVGAQNYVYWSSPVEGFNVANVNMATSEARYQWNPTQAGLNGTWNSASGTMTVGRGYIVRGLDLPPSPIPANTAEFLGRPSNGIITTPISRGTYSGPDYLPVGGGATMATDIDDNWNLVGNPYPSAISASAFIAENTTGTPKIDGTIYLWSHDGLPSGGTTQDPFYGDYVYNYLGADYVATNGVGSNPPVFYGNIAAGQSFFVQMLDGAGVSNTLTFNNGMRSGSPANDNFLRSGERHRIWLDLINSNDVASSTLVGYVINATNDRDLLFDGYDLSDTSMQFYSLIGEDEMTIQGRQLPFEQEDRVPLGFTVPQNANYKIAINSLDGLFADVFQNVYLEDTYLNTIVDLRYAPYTFTSNSGTFNDRFILRYTNETLSTPEQVANFGFNIIGLKDYIKVTSGSSQINTVVVYDVLGRVLADYKDINALEFKLDLINQSNGALIVKATLYNGQQKIKKVIY
ncbi:MAG: GEVED domain-containing protein [Aquaticitalea sp.]